MNQPSPRVRRIAGVRCAMPFVRDTKVATAFERLREKTIAGAGFDFLSVLGDMMRARDFQSSKPGVASRSRHKCGDAFDVNQEDARLLVVREDRAGKVYFRVYLKCSKQDGSMGQLRTISPYVFARRAPGKSLKLYTYDFTAAAEAEGFERIPAWSEFVRTGQYILSEWWHYQMTEGLSFDEAISFLYSAKSLAAPQPAAPVEKSPDDRVLGLNDRGEDVRAIQQQLARINFLAATEADGIFGSKTQAAVKAFQRASGLVADGLLGPRTRAMLAARQ